MDDLFDDERIRFFLRNRDDIKQWAAIESDVILAIREMFGRTMPSVADGVSAVDPAAIISRHDSGPWERVLARHEAWPEATGMSIEWHRSVDLVGTWPAKLGVFWWTDRPDVVGQRARDLFRARAAEHGLALDGYKVPLEVNWPVGTFLAPPQEWWLDATAWVQGVVDRLVFTWPRIAPLVDEACAVEREASRG